MTYRKTKPPASGAEQAFLAGSAVHPFPLIQLEKGGSHPSLRTIDLLCPIGRGQRGLLVSSPGLGKTTLLQQICKSVAKGYPEMQIYCLLIDERPEEVTDFRRNANGEVYASSLDQPAEHHLSVVQDLMPKAYEAAAAGKHVLILLDSLTRLTRAFDKQGASGKGRTLSGGLSAESLTIPRQIFGAARNVENQGSITMLATILVDTGSLMDTVIFEEFKGTGNMELVLSKELAAQRLFPAVNVLKSGTRRNELFFTDEENDCRQALHQLLAKQKDPVAAMQCLHKLFDKHPDNQSLLASFS